MGKKECARRYYLKHRKRLLAYKKMHTEDWRKIREGRVAL